MMELRWIICLHSLEGADVGRVRANERITVEVCSLANAGLVLIYSMVNLRSMSEKSKKDMNDEPQWQITQPMVWAAQVPHLR